MTQIHPRISDENDEYLASLEAVSGLSRSQVVDLILSKARELGWRITPGDAPRVTYLMS